MPRARITNILFDLDGTLRFNRPSSAHFFLDYAASLGVQDSKEKRCEAIRWSHRYWAQSPEMIQDFQTYPDETSFWRHYSVLFLKAFGSPMEQAESLGTEIYEYMSTEHKPVGVVPQSVHETLAMLQEDGFQLGLVSNRTKPVHEEIAELGLDHYFEIALVAGEVSSWKPDTAIFEHALEQMDAQPKESIYIGDNYYADVLGARAAGIQPILFDEDRIFPQADCPVIVSMDELPVWIANLSNHNKDVISPKQE